MTARACTRCHSPLEIEDLRCAVCALPTPRLARDERPAESVAQILRCNGCGAGVQYSAEARAPRCDFCGAVMELETPEDPVEQAERYLDFTVTDAQARAALKQWLGRKSFFRPSDLQSRAAVDGLKPLWWAGWMFDAAASVCWAADSNAGSRRSAWAPHSGEFTMEAENVVVPASVGLTADECRALARHCDLGRSSDEPQGHPGATVEQFTLQRSAARKVISEALEGVARSRAKPHIPGTAVRKLHVSVLPSRLTTSHLAFPAFVLAYRYRDKLYRAVVHGQDPSCVLGKAPVSWPKIALVVLGVIGLVGLVVLALSVV
ncbi:MAG: zinc ribbon domain-containing protein [Nannocystales bacterium]